MEYLPNIPSHLKPSLIDVIEHLGLTSIFMESHWGKSSSNSASAFDCCNRDWEDNIRGDVKLASAIESVRTALEPFVPAIKAYWASCSGWDGTKYAESDPSLLPDTFMETSK